MTMRWRALRARELFKRERDVEARQVLWGHERRLSHARTRGWSWHGVWSLVWVSVLAVAVAFVAGLALVVFV